MAITSSVTSSLLLRDMKNSFCHPHTFTETLYCEHPLKYPWEIAEVTANNLAAKLGIAREEEKTNASEIVEDVGSDVGKSGRTKIPEKNI